MLTADSGGPPSWLIDLGVQLGAGLITMALTLLIQARWIPSPRPRPGSRRSHSTDEPSSAQPNVAEPGSSTAGVSTTGDGSPAITGNGNAMASGSGSTAVSGDGNTFVTGGGSVYNVSTVYGTVAGQGGDSGVGGSIAWALVAGAAAVLLSVWWPVLVAACYGAALALILMLVVAIVRSTRYLNRWPAGSALRVLTVGLLVATLVVLVAWLQLAPFGGPRFSDLSVALAEGMRAGQDQGTNPIAAALNAAFALGSGAPLLAYGTIAIVIWAMMATVVRGALVSWLSFLRVAGPRATNQKDRARAANATWKRGSIELLVVILGCAVSLFFASGLLVLFASA